MKIYTILTILFLSHSVVCQAFNLDTNSWNDFEGKIDSSDIQLSLYLFENGEIKGNYCYKKYETKIQLFGHLSGNEIELTEMIGNTENGFFKGKIFTDSLDRFEGKWKNKTKTKELKFELTLSSICSGSYVFRYSSAFYGTTSEIENFMKQIKTSILNNDKNWLSNHICYPITVTLNKTRTVKITNKKELLENYDKIIHNDFKKKISEYYTVNLFNNWRGAMIGNGEIWINNKPNSTENNYDYCITTINN